MWVSKIAGVVIWVVRKQPIRVSHVYIFPVIYIRIPKKFIDFNRSGKGANGEEAEKEEAAEGDEGDKKKKKSSRLSKKGLQGPTYQLQDPLVWKLKIDGADSEEAGREPNVCLDVLEPMENL